MAPNPGPFTFRGTGVYIVGAGKSVAVIDPGPDLPEHIEALKRALHGRKVSHILVTHTHNDHSPAARPLTLWSGAPTYGFGPHAETNDVEEGGDRLFVPGCAGGGRQRDRGRGFHHRAASTRPAISPTICAMRWRKKRRCSPAIM